MDRQYCSCKPLWNIDKELNHITHWQALPEWPK